MSLLGSLLVTLSRIRSLVALGFVRMLVDLIVDCLVGCGYLEVVGWL